jgi:hypothetical protein
MIPAPIKKLPGVQGLLTLATWVQRLHFDWRNNVQTTGDVALNQLDPIDGSIENAVHYHPTHPRAARRILSSLPISDYSKYTFLDLGSGKGLMLFAAAEFPFARIEGIEFAKSLHEAAVRNIASYRSSRRRCDTIVSTNIDATTFRFPLEPLVVFLFNPFRHQVLQSVLANLEESVRSHPRDVVVVYLSPLDARYFKQLQSFEPCAPSILADTLVFRSTAGLRR